jgi:hypothetical protein
MIVFNKIYFIFSCMNVVVSLRRNVGNRESLILYNARIFDLVERNKESFLVSTYCMNVVVSLRRNVGNRESLVLYMRGFFDLAVRNKESFWSVHTLCANIRCLEYTE